MDLHEEEKWIGHIRALVREGKTSADIAHLLLIQNELQEWTSKQILMRAFGLSSRDSQVVMGSVLTPDSAPPPFAPNDSWLVPLSDEWFWPPFTVVIERPIGQRFTRIFRISYYSMPSLGTRIQMDWGDEKTTNASWEEPPINHIYKEIGNYIFHFSILGNNNYEGTGTVIIDPLSPMEELSLRGTPTWSWFPMKTTREV